MKNKVSSKLGLAAIAVAFLALVLLNNLFLNKARLDLTEGQIYSIFSKNDKILMFRKFDNYFLNPKHRNLQVLDYSSHAMPYLKPIYCCQIIEKLIKFFLKNNYNEK